MALGGGPPPGISFWTIFLTIQEEWELKEKGLRVWKLSKRVIKVCTKKNNFCRLKEAYTSYKGTPKKEK